MNGKLCEMKLPWIIWGLNKFIFLLITGVVLCASAGQATVTPQISAGYGHTVALFADGTVMTWAANTYDKQGKWLYYRQ